MVAVSFQVLSFGLTLLLVGHLFAGSFLAALTSESTDGHRTDMSDEAPSSLVE